MARTNTIAIITRRNDTMELILRGKSHLAIRRLISAKYNISESAVANDINKCYNLLKVDGEVELEAIVSKHMTMYYSLYEKMVDAEDYRGASIVLEKIDKLKGLTSLPQVNTQINIGVSADSVSNLSEEQIRSLLSSTTTISQK